MIEQRLTFRLIRNHSKQAALGWSNRSLLIGGSLLSACLLIGCEPRHNGKCPEPSTSLDSLSRLLISAQSGSEQVTLFAKFRAMHHRHMATFSQDSDSPPTLTFIFLDSTGLEVRTMSGIMEAKWMMAEEEGTCSSFRRFLLHPTDALKIAYNNVRLTDDCMNCKSANDK